MNEENRNEDPDISIDQSETDQEDDHMDRDGLISADSDNDHVREQSHDVDEDEEDDAESSIDLFIRFLQTLFKKLSKRAKKASRSLLPAAISPQLVFFLLLFSESLILYLTKCSSGYSNCCCFFNLWFKLSHQFNFMEFFAAIVGFLLWDDTLEEIK